MNKILNELEAAIELGETNELLIRATRKIQLLEKELAAYKDSKNWTHATVIKDYGTITYPNALYIPKSRGSTA